MTAERAQPSDLDHAQQRLAGLEAQLCATLEDTLRLTNAGELDAAIIRLEDQSNALDAVMDALARDVSGIRLAPSPPKRTRTRGMLRWAAAAAIIAVTSASVAVLLDRDPLANLAIQIDTADRTQDPRARLTLVENAYASLRSVPASDVAASTVRHDLARTALRTQRDLAETDAPATEQQRAAIIARALNPQAPVAPQSGAGSPTDPVVKKVRGG